MDPKMTKKTIGFIGLGVMGAPMAQHLAAAGHDVRVYNRTTAKAEAFVSAHGGTLALTPVAAADNADVVLSCVGNDDDLRAVTFGAGGAFGGMAKGALFIDHSTVSAAVSRELAAEADAAGFAVVAGGLATPVIGHVLLAVHDGAVQKVARGMGAHARLRHAQQVRHLRGHRRRRLREQRETDSFVDLRSVERVPDRGHFEQPFDRDESRGDIAERAAFLFDQFERMDDTHAVDDAVGNLRRDDFAAELVISDRLREIALHLVGEGGGKVAAGVA